MFYRLMRSPLLPLLIVCMTATSLFAQEVYTHLQ